MHGVHAAAPHRYWAAHLYRIGTAVVVARFDAWAPGAVAVGVVVGLLAGLVPLPVPRRAVRRAAVTCLLLVLVLRAGVAVDAWRAGRGPNLLLISIDALRADHLGAYGYGPPTSPALDHRLAAQGVTFLDVVSQSPKTTPSHMTMLTGLYPCAHRVPLWSGTGPARRLNPAVHTLAEVLRDAGFATAAFTGGAHMDGARGFRDGFDVYEDVGLETQLGHALRWLKYHRRSRFFLFVHTYSVHDPYIPPQRQVARFAPDVQGPIFERVQELRADQSDWEHRAHRFWESVDAGDPRAVAVVTQLYDAGIRDMDDVLLPGLLDALDRWELTADTLVVFTSDHGEAFYEHGAFLHDDLYAGTLHVPLVLRFPGRLPAGRRVAARGRLVDVMPTVLELLGVRAPEEGQGQSLVPLVSAAGEPRDAPSEHADGSGMRMAESLRHGSLTLLVEGTRERLFDRATDPEERQDLAATRPEVVRALRTALRAHTDACDARAATVGAREDGEAPSAERVRQLRALGYLE